MPSLPTGTVTFLFTDIEGSTRLLEHLGDIGSAEVFADHRRLLRTAFGKRGGREIEIHGDGFLFAFQSAQDAFMAAIEAQQAVSVHPWPRGVALRVRMGLHSGEAVTAAIGYVGLVVHRAARICQAGHGGQILLSDATRAIIQDDAVHDVSLRDLGEYRLKDLSRPQRIYQAVGAKLPSDFPPLKSLTRLLNNLPIQLTSFVGREREMAEIKRLMEGTRLLTLTGIGGCGKTRLALQVAADLLEVFTDGVWFVEFASLANPSLVPQTVATALGLREQPARDLTATLVDYLQRRRALLVLDNCEHLVAASAQLAGSLLRSCPDLRILATSRELLSVAGETSFRVPSLSLPGLPQLPSSERLREYEAVRLFIERATAASPTFLMTDRNASTVAQVCHRLDGIPLAIELAAARVRMLSPAEIAKRLDYRFRLLTGGNRTGLARHQTLQAAMDWSYDLLSTAERALLRRLSVFAGGFTLEATEAICAGEGFEHAEVLNLLTHLIDKSLVMLQAQNGHSRYQMLETVRQYGEERLQESAEAERFHSRHRDWYVRLAEKGDQALRGSDPEAWLELFESEHENFRAALGWCQREQDGAAAELRLAVALGEFWFGRGYWSEGRKWLENAAARTASAPDPTRVEALKRTGHLALFQGDYDAALGLFQESLAISRDLGDRQRIADSLDFIGHLIRDRGDYAGAKALHEEGLALSRELGSDGGVADALYGLGRIAASQGHYAEALNLFQGALDLRQKIANKRAIAYCYFHLGNVSRLAEDNLNAATWLEKSLTLHREMGNKQGIAQALCALGDVERRRGDYAQAGELAQESLALFRDLGNKGALAWSLNHAALLKLDHGDHPQAMTLLRESIVLSAEVGNKEILVQSLELMAYSVAHAQPVRAVRLLGASEAIREALGIPLPTADRVDHDKNVAVVRNALGEDGFAAAREEGRAMMREQAIDYALGKDI